MRYACSLAFIIAGVLHGQDGAALYKDRCASCHDAPEAGVPSLAAIKQMTANAVYGSMVNGSMQSQASGLSRQQLIALLVYIAPAGGADAKPAFDKNCPPSASGFQAAHAASGWPGWSPSVTNTRFQDAAAAGLAASDVPKLRLKWAFNLGVVTMARGQPAVAGNRVFIGTLAGDVYALDMASGCIHWSAKATAGIRSGVAIGEANGVPAIFFADRSAVMYAFAAESGQLLWKTRPVEHQLASATATPQYHNGIIYAGFSSLESSLAEDPNADCCSSRGSLVALDAATGRILWENFTILQPARPRGAANRMGPSGAPIWSTPTIDEQRGLLYVATGNNYSAPVTDTSDAVLAFDMKSGVLEWWRQFTEGDAFNGACIRDGANCPGGGGSDFDFGQPPILVQLGGGKRALVVGQKSGMVHAIDPDARGKVLWQTRAGAGGLLGGSQWGSAADGQHVYVAISDVDRIESGGRMTLDPKKGGGLHAIDLSTGRMVWSARPAECPGTQPICSPAQSAAVTAIPGVVFSGSLDGHLRAYSSTNGEVMWDFDTARDFPSVNGPPVRGGSIDATGTAVAGGVVFITSGYDQFGGMPGNALLAFSVDGQ